MIITAYGRRYIESSDYKLLKEASMNHILISITDSYKNNVDMKYVKECSYCKDILIRYFQDVDSRHLKYSSKEHKIFSDHDAQRILHTVDKHINNISSIIVNCDAGISRSQGTAAALSKILNETDDYYFKNFHPNMLVYTKILNEYYTNEEDYPNIYQYHIKNCVTPRIEKEDY